MRQWGVVETLLSQRPPHRSGETPNDLDPPEAAPGDPRPVGEKGIDLFKFEKRLAMSLEPDLKRAPSDPRMIDMESRQRAHISLDTRP